MWPNSTSKPVEQALISRERLARTSPSSFHCGPQRPDSGLLPSMLTIVGSLLAPEPPAKRKSYGLKRTTEEMPEPEH